MSKNIKLLDCTLRDGAYIVDSMFGTPAIKGIISKLQDSNIDIIECGWLKNTTHKEGSSFYHVPTDLEQYLINKNAYVKYVAMIDWDRYDLSYLPVRDGSSLDAIRVVFPYGKHREGLEVGRQIKEKGYDVYFQAANTLSYNDDDLVDLARCVNQVNPLGLSIVDTFGAMYEEDLDRIVSVLNRELNDDIALGFHSHNNQQLSFSLSTHFVKVLKDSKRDLIVDSSLCGMGRGAGNATTELLVSYLNKKCECHYDLDSIMDAIDIYMEYFKENYEWGYSTPYFIAGLYCCHVNNIAYLSNNHRTSFKDMRNVIESLSEEDRKKYDYDLLEDKYLKNQSFYIDDSEAVNKLKQAFANRKIIIVAPGKSSVAMQKVIKTFISENNPIVIAVNAILSNYQYDYLFFSNVARYEYAKNTHLDIFNNTKKLVLSNICGNETDEIVIGYNNVVKRGWEHYDNAVILALRLLNFVGASDVYIAGFDGFKTKYNESYGDPFLPSLNPNNKWDELNVEIKDMFDNFIKKDAKNMAVHFITPSIFEGNI